jgi:phosphoenolpyruvate carboxykinase (GTP)
VNWFRKDDDCKFIWNGFSENSKILKWIFLQNQTSTPSSSSSSSAFGEHPSFSDLYLNGVNDHDNTSKWNQLFSCKPEEVSHFKNCISEFFNDLEKNSPVGIPHELKEELNKLC